METSEIDRRLQRYTAAEHRIGANLQELEQHSVYQLLTTDVLVGKTAAAFAPLLDADPDVWQLFTLLGSALETARKIRGTGNRLSPSVRTDLGNRLSGPSVIVATRNIPLGERSLTADSTNTQRMSIEMLIERMSHMYEPVRDVVTHAETVLREVLPRLNSAEATSRRLRSEAVALGLDTVDLDRIDETIMRVRDLSLTDPLSIPPDARSSFDRSLHDAGVRISQARTSHDNLATDLAAASDLLDECRDLIEQAVRYRSETLTKIAAPIGLRQPPSPLAVDGDRGLAGRLDEIVDSNAPWQAVRSRLDLWMSTAQRFRDQLERVATANRAPLDRRAELRGRLHAFRAKMAATGNSEDPVLRDMSAEAHNELFTSPSDLVRAERLVREFGERLAR